MCFNKDVKTTIDVFYTKETTMLSHQLSASDKNTNIHNLQLREQYTNPIALIAYLKL